MVRPRKCVLGLRPLGMKFEALYLDLGKLNLCVAKLPDGLLAAHRFALPFFFVALVGFSVGLLAASWASFTSASIALTLTFSSFA